MSLTPTCYRFACTFMKLSSNDGRRCPTCGKYKPRENHCSDDSTPSQTWPSIEPAPWRSDSWSSSSDDISSSSSSSFDSGGGGDAGGGGCSGDY